MEWIASHRVGDITINDCGFTDLHLSLVTQHETCGQLHTLDLRDNRISPTGIQSLCQSPHLLRLLALDVSENNIRNQGVKYLMMALDNSLVSLERLGLSCTGITEPGLKEIIDSTSAARLKEIDLSQLEMKASTRKQLQLKFGGALLA